MFQKIVGFSIFLSFLLFSITPVYAIEDPLAQPNNKIGIHILFPSEIVEAAKLINSNGGDWGYVTIPLSSTDRDLRIWQEFMDNCKKHHVIPLVRLATTHDPNDTTVWKKPVLNDVIESATFLNKLDWPTKNRYVIIYNEVNRADEWGGKVDPAEYANILSFAVSVFKSKSPDYFVISAGLDNAAPSQGTEYQNQYDFMRKMHDAVPAILRQVDGLASHSYPNPGFSQPPTLTNRMGVASFSYERALAQELTGKTLPVFITETGWSSEKISDEQKLQFYEQTLTTIWNDPGIVAITPFILDARHGVFTQFSFITATGGATKQYDLVKKTAKIKGSPGMPVRVLAAEATSPNLPTEITKEVKKTFFSHLLASMLKWFNG